MTSRSGASRLRFGPFVLDRGAYRLTRNEVEVAVSPRLIDLLAYLAVRASDLVTKDELVAAGWPDVAVSDNSLTQAISDLRQALGDSASRPAYIQTVARRGYRFIAEVEELAARAPTPEAPPASADRPRRARETSSLEAARAFSEGRWRLEALDADLVPAAIQEFERAISLDPTFAAPHLGLANALFWQAEASRDLLRPDTATLARAVDAARRAVALEPDLAEAHATLGYVLAGAGHADEARAAAERAVALEPGYWAHYFRLGHASWGDARLRAHARTLELYPDFAFAHLQMAMVFVARGDLATAESALRQGIVVHDRHRGRAERFPARGLHWLLGLVLDARGDEAGALVALERETDAAPGRLYAREFAVSAKYAIAVIHLRRGDGVRADEWFAHAHAQNPTHARTHFGRATVWRRLGRGTDADTEHAHAMEVVAELERAGRGVEAVLCDAVGKALDGDTTRACERLASLVESAPPGPTGWIIGVEPAFASLRGSPDGSRVLALIADRAR